MRTLNNYSFQTRYFVPDEDQDDKSVVMDLKFLVLDASTLLIAALGALDIAIEPRREKFHTLNAPKVILDNLSRRNLFQEMEEVSEGIWVYQIPHIPGNYYEVRCLEIVKPDVLS